jgi:lysophospholipase L1-like esterase
MCSRSPATRSIARRAFARLRFKGGAIFVVLALVAGSLVGGCDGSGATPGGSGGAAGTSTATGGAPAGGAGGSARGGGNGGGDVGGRGGMIGASGASGGVAGAAGTVGLGGSAAGAGGLGGTGGGAGGQSGGAGTATPDGGMDATGGAIPDAGGGWDGGSAGRPGGTGGGGAGTGAAGTGGTGTYNPCPTIGSPCKILPFGDSITRGVKSSDDAGYRSQLFKLIVAGKQKVTFTGSLTNGPTTVSGQTFPSMHEGHPGWTIDPGYNMISSSYGGISSLVPSPALNGNPNIILLHIGTNDLFARDTANMSTRLEALLDKIAANAPSALIVLAQITPRGTTDAALTTYNGRIPGIVQSHAAKGQHIIGVDMSKLPVPADLSSDGTHPNDQGYAYMAAVWYAAIKDLLPK